MNKHEAKYTSKANNENELKNKIGNGVELLGEEIYNSFHSSQMGAEIWNQARIILKNVGIHNKQKDPLEEAVNILMEGCKTWMVSLSPLNGARIFEQNSNEISECFYAGVS